jgi:hypothetical protein
MQVFIYFVCYLRLQEIMYSNSFIFPFFYLYNFRHLHISFHFIRIDELYRIDTRGKVFHEVSKIKIKVFLHYRS